MQKNQIRKKIIKDRKIKNLKNLQPNLNILFQLLKKKKIKKKVLGSYFPVNFEIDTFQIMQKLKEKGFILSLPIIKKKNYMDFYKWDLNEPLYINKYGIPEPKKKHKLIPSVILIPLVAFDKNLNRLGYGGGFYDRFLSKIEKFKILKIGLAFSSQKVKSIPINKFDKKMDYILTEKKLYK